MIIIIIIKEESGGMAGLSDTRDIIRALSEIRGSKGRREGAAISSGSSDEEDGRGVGGMHQEPTPGRRGPSTLAEANPTPAADPGWDQSPIPPPHPVSRSCPQKNHHPGGLSSSPPSSSPAWSRRPPLRSGRAQGSGGAKMVSKALEEAADVAGMARSSRSSPSSSSAKTMNGSGRGAGGGSRGGGRGGLGGVIREGMPSPNGKEVSLMELMVPGSSGGGSSSGRAGGGSKHPPSSRSPQPLPKSTLGSGRRRGSLSPPAKQALEDHSDDDDDDLRVILAFDPALLDKQESPPRTASFVAQEPRSAPPYAMQVCTRQDCTADGVELFSRPGFLVSPFSRAHVPPPWGWPVSLGALRFRRMITHSSVHSSTLIAQAALQSQQPAASPPSPPKPDMYPSLDDSIGLPVFRPSGAYNLPTSLRKPASAYVNPEECFDNYR